MTSDLRPEAKNVVRRIIAIWRVPDGLTESGWRINMDGGEPCPHCGLADRPIGLVCANWATPVEDEEVKP